MFLGVLGCTETPSDHLLEQRQEIVFNKFNVDQPRGNLDYVQEEISDPISQQQHAIATLAHRSSAAVGQKACKLVQNTNETVVEIGSGMMTSSKRMMTALHVVNNPELNTEKENKIEVYFGTIEYNNTDPADHFFTVSGDYVADKNFSLGGLEPEYEAGRFNASEEEPFLAMRLFQLGLDEWAVHGNATAKTIREHLRTWRFDYAQGSCLNQANLGTFKCQGYASRDNFTFNIQGEDIAVLEAQNLYSAYVGEGDAEAFYFQHNSAKPKSGPFPLDRPGVFFDHMSIGATKTFQGVENDTPLWLNHTNKWPDDKSDSSSRIISRPGYALQEFAFISDVMPRRVKNICGEREHIMYETVQTSLDFKSGSSGGMVMAPNIHEYQPDGTYEDVTQQMIGIGIVVGSTGKEPTWIGAGQVDIHEPSPGIYNGDAVNYFTAILDPSFPSDDGDPPVFTPNDPESCGEDGSGNCIPCAVFNSNNECIVTFDEPSEYPTGGSLDLPVDFRDISEDDKSAQTERVGKRFVKCTFDQFGKPYIRSGANASGRVYPGMVVGFMGASKGPFYNEEGISDIYAICAPASSRSYTENWHLLRSKGSNLPRKSSNGSLTNIHGRRAWGELNSAMQESYVVREGAPKGQMIRPLPMKFCPPNYILDGINVRVHNGKGVIGISDLHCRKSHNPLAQQVSGPDEMLVSLDAGTAGVEGYTMFSDIYTLDQRLGNVNSMAGWLVPMRCPNQGFISGLEMTHDDTGLLEHIHPKCTPYAL